LEDLISSRNNNCCCLCVWCLPYHTSETSFCSRPAPSFFSLSSDLQVDVAIMSDFYKEYSNHGLPRSCSYQHQRDPPDPTNLIPAVADS
jgi:hypothetical protein